MGGTLIFSRDDRYTRIVIDPFTGRISSEKPCTDLMSDPRRFYPAGSHHRTAITGFVLGGLFFSWAAARPTWRSQESLTRLL